MTGGFITGVFRNMILACFMNNRGDFTGNHLLSKNESMPDAIAPGIVPRSPNPVVAAKRNSFAGSESSHPTAPIDSTYLPIVSSEDSLGDPLSNHVLRDCACFECLKS